MADSQSTTPVEYRAISGFPGYRVGNDGSVWTIKANGGNDKRPGRRAQHWRRLIAHVTRTGYHRVHLINDDGKSWVPCVHRLVLDAFVGPRPSGMQACHYPDFDKGNNRLENLRWDTHAENERDEYRDRSPVESKRCTRCGEEKHRDEFRGDKRRPDGTSSWCKTCHRHVVLDTRDPDKKRKANREYMRRKRATDPRMWR